MATIVAHRQTGQRYLAIGTGFGMSESATPGLFFGNLSPNVAQHSMSLIAVCDAAGIIGWFPLAEIVVVDVDGKPPQHWLGGAPPYR